MLISCQSQWSESLIGEAEVLLVDRWEFPKIMRPVDVAGISSAMLLSITRRGLRLVIGNHGLVEGDLLVILVDLS